MTHDQTRAVLTVALMAAFADGLKDDRERTRVRELAARLPAEGIDLPALYQEVLLGKPDLATVAQPLAADPALAQFAYEMAVGVVDADGAHSGAEGAFLDRLAQALKLPAAQARAYVEQADAIAAVPGVPVSVPAAAGAAAPVAGVDAAAIDKQIVDASITNAALELLPESLASMAILPLQVRLVYKIGKAYGYELDQGHIKEFIAALGVGLTGQYLEQFGRKLLGGLLGSVLGGMGRTIGKQAASSGMAFASTWALGQVARQYYASGRKLDMEKLKSAFTPLVQQGQTMIQQYGPQISERARSINVRSLPQLIGR
ncbi:MAG: hypothetical protein BroJett026_10350 [Betaproteobacteria bacterium]|nr:MAG: hypothetical protein BroJett026_10350 [Betaproteobacteria bacterium]